MEFKEQLSRIRKERGYNQEQLAEKVGVSRQAVSKWETGDAQPALSQLIALANALNISLDTLCCRTCSDSDRGLDDDGLDDGSRNEDTSDKDDHRAVLLAAFFPFLLAALIVAGMYFHLYRQNAVPSEAAAAAGLLPDTIEVTGLNFRTEETPHRLYYEFVPSVVDNDLIYTLTFTDSTGQSQSFEIQCDNGACHGTATLSEGSSFSAVLEISSDSESRATALATDLTFGDGRVSWNPVRP